MSDYCYPCCGNSDKESNRIVRLKFLRSQLLYDIKNYAYIEADVMGEEKQHAQHVLADIGEEGNIDRVSRILSVIHTEVIELLYPFTKQEPVEEEIDDHLLTPSEYIVELNVPSNMSRTTIKLLSRLIHEYMVYRVLSDWLSITNPDAAVKWAVKADSIEKEIENAKTTHKGVFIRKTHPW